MDYGLLGHGRNDPNTHGYASVNSHPKPVVARKKFAVPPVKVACLECRASRCRCDGNPVQCSNCVNKGKRCVYVQSKRGGSRIRKRKVSSSDASISPPANNGDLNQAALSVLPETGQVTFAGPLSFVSPGGGLRQLDLLPDDAEFVFDGSFGSSEVHDSGYEGSDNAGIAGSIVEQSPTPIRTYSSNDAILGAYYTFIHPYFPVLPPPVPHQIVDDPDFGIRYDRDAIFTSIQKPDFEPDSPLSLALSASLALIPHPDDPEPTSAESVKLRREQGKAFAQVAFETIEKESELVESNDNPADALSSEPISNPRQPFHLHNPVENENVIALLLLSTFEYAQRGNVTKMRNRAGQALNAAMDLGLHAKGDEDGFFAEANRRTWWMAYIVACQGAILSNSTPPMLLYDPRFTTPPPSFGKDKESWEHFVLAQQVITNATQFVIDLDVVLKARSDPSEIWRRMLELDTFIEPLVNAANTWTVSPAAKLDPAELCVSQALRGMARIKLNSARIKLHRYNAFSDIPVFSKKHCDLRSSGSAANTGNATNSPGCACSTTLHELQNGGTPHNLATVSPVTALSTTFSSNTSANVAYQCAFNIADSYSKLPLPQPVQTHSQQQQQSFNYTPSSPQTFKLPRMIPIFSCCAMQSSYAMIMLYHRSKNMGLMDDYSDGRSRSMSMSVSMPQTKLFLQLQKGLHIILEALTNYSIAYEALGGMRDQIELSIQSLGFARRASG